MYKIVLLRHGESTWNKKGLFTGWTDVDLSAHGREEARSAGKSLKRKGFIFDYAFTSRLKRAIKTLDLVLKELKLTDIPIKNDWRLNERRYGDLQGRSKQAMIEKYGERQVFLWRRGYTTRPPAGESLQDVERRVVPYWKEKISPQIKKGKRVIISASGNSLRALVKYLDKLSASAVAELNIPTGLPLVYELDEKLKPFRHYYLADARTLKAAVEKTKTPGAK
ncbi:MAG: 2,3-bisphosphoglycerate-dependent phosphoglycerate mutase [Patescibacteria group bacterium]|jgi:2,3-bisphosphoglycerate-dependent phosphoglycerate mutase